MKKKVISGKRAGLNILVSAMILVELFLAGCGKKETTSVADNKQTIEAPAETPAPTAKLEATIDPEIAKQEEEKRTEDAAKAYYERLSTIPGYANDANKVLEFTKRFNGNYSSLRSLSGLDDETRRAIKMDYYDEMVMFILDFTNSLVYNVGNGNHINIDIDSEKVFVNNQNGKDLVGIVENMAKDVYEAGYSEDESFYTKASEFTSLVSNLYFSSTTGGTAWNGILLPNLGDLDTDVQVMLKNYVMTYLRIIDLLSHGKEITASDNICITVKLLLSWFEGGLTCEEVANYDKILTQVIFDDMQIYQGLNPTSTATPKLALTNEQ